MNDAFATLGLPRQLAIDSESVETAWRLLSRELHPDSGSGDAEKSADANRARQILASPLRRLRHWLELQGVELPRQAAIDSSLMELFGEISNFLSKADDLIKRRAAASSALTRALLAEEEFSLQRGLQGLLGRIQREKTVTTDEFEAIEIAAESGDFSRALSSAGRLGFLEKWEQQVQQRLMSLIAGE